MSAHFNSCLMNDVMLRLEAQSFFANIGKKRTLSFVRRALALCRHHDGNPGEALAGVGQRLGICYYCWDRGHDLRQGICSDCRVADAIGIEPGEAGDRLPGKGGFSYPFIRRETVLGLLELLPERLTADLDVGTLRKLPGDCIEWDEATGGAGPATRRPPPRLVGHGPRLAGYGPWLPGHGPRLAAHGPRRLLGQPPSSRAAWTSS